MKLGFALKITFLFSLRQMLYCKVEGSETDKAVVQGSNNFALKLLHVLSSNEGAEKNLFFSPTSLSIALGMVFLGSRGKTASQIADVFNWNKLKSADIHAVFKTLHETIHGPQYEEFELKLANRIWGHIDFQPTVEFASSIREFYGSEITPSDFGRESERIRAEINEWVHQQTNGKIKELLAAGMLSSDTKLALINAIYFYGTWKYEFDQQKTFRGPFYALGRRENEVEVEMLSMTTKLNFYYDEEHDCRLLQLPYSGNKLSMLLLLPDELNGLSELEKSLSVEMIDSWALLMTNTTVSVELPKFQLNQKFELKQVLPKLGISDVFDANKADLSGISETTGLFVSNILHKAHIEINEKGTEAAGATGVVMRKRSVDMNEIFHADHPFLFVIRHHVTGLILFVGRLQQPQNIERSHTRDRLTADEL